MSERNFLLYRFYRLGSSQVRIPRHCLTIYQGVDTYMDKKDGQNTTCNVVSQKIFLKKHPTSYQALKLDDLFWGQLYSVYLM